jgi:Domain of unknown function (DUF4380)
MTPKTDFERPVVNSSCSVCRTGFGGWDSIRLGNGIIELFVVPQIGGRIIQLRMGGEKLFYVNPRHRGRVYGPEENDFVAGWKNYGGSKVWPAPQGWSATNQWPGPPDPVLDGGLYDLRIIEDRSDSAAVYLESPQDQYTGLTFSREIRVFRDSSSVRTRHEMRNTSSRAVRWAIWQVTQQVANRGLTVFVPGTTFRQIYGDKRYPCIRLASDKAPWSLRYKNQVAKFLLNPEQGWVTALHGESGIALVETFPIFKGLPYPDNASVEIWVNGKGSFTIHGERIDTVTDPNGCDPFVETEILSPLVELEPGQRYIFEIFWNCAVLEGDEIKATNRHSTIVRPLTVTCRNNILNVSGAYGFFHVGRLEMVSICRDGEEGSTLDLGSVSPLAARGVNVDTRYEEGLSRISLRLHDAEGKLLGTVDEAVL